MTLLSFTSAAKYVLTLLLAMLGYIPYEDLNEIKKLENQNDQVYFENAKPTSECEFSAISFEYNKVDLKTDDINRLATNTIIEKDSLFVVVICHEANKLENRVEYAVLLEE